MTARPDPASETGPELIDQVAHAEEQIRLLRREVSSTDPGTDHGPEVVRQLLRRQIHVIAELRRRRARNITEQNHDSDSSQGLRGDTSPTGASRRPICGLAAVTCSLPLPP